MGAIVLTPYHAASARIVARRIGRSFARARRQAGDRQADTARRLGLRQHECVSRFECGHRMNVPLGVIVRYLAAYGLTLAVVPDKPRAVARQGE